MHGIFLAVLCCSVFSSVKDLLPIRDTEWLCLGLAGRLRNFFPSVMLVLFSSRVFFALFVLPNTSSASFSLVCELEPYGYD